MLKHLSITNYALIDQLDIDFQSGFSVITGETGAGKSIILGALSLILGSRSDSSNLKNESKKCIIEGVFKTGNLNLETVFVENDLDYDDDTILRREILPSGKSRAFVNDTPVNLKMLNLIGNKLVNIHSQHQTLQLGELNFQLDVLDGFAGNEDLAKEFGLLYNNYILELNNLEVLKESMAKATRDEDYIRYQLSELGNINLNSEAFFELENRLSILEHSEEIKSALSESDFILNDDESSITSNLSRLIRLIDGVNSYLPSGRNISSRLKSILVDIEDVSRELQLLSPDDELDVGELQSVSERIDRINSLINKHGVADITELAKIRSQFESDLSGLETREGEISEAEKRINKIVETLNKLAEKLKRKRLEVRDGFENSILDIIRNLGMKDAEFKVSITDTKELGPSGKDKVVFLFNANKGAKPGEISKIASGGELSRLMLAIKSMINKQQMMPTVIFDEIDSGISGDIAGKVGRILKDMAIVHQVVAITHLPQIASKAKVHFKVSKVSGTQDTTTTIEQLDDDGRIEEISSMLSSEKITDTARNVARELINE